MKASEVGWGLASFVELLKSQHQGQMLAHGHPPGGLLRRPATRAWGLRSPAGTTGIGEVAFDNSLSNLAQVNTGQSFPKVPCRGRNMIYVTRAPASGDELRRPSCASGIPNAGEELLPFRRAFCFF